MTLSILLWCIIIFIFLLRGNFSVYIINLKIFQNFFWGDIEILLSVWGLLFIIIVLVISSRVIVFSFSYIRRLIVRNFVLLYLSFVFRIIWLIVRVNFYWLILGWDGLGVVSFLLILFYINHESINNGLFTIFQNRLGDIFFVFFIIGMLDIIIYSNFILKWGLFFLIIGRCVKRAQFPFNSWLLAAIRAPTPISSLVHSSTLVVAGVYIILQYRYCDLVNLFRLKLISVLRLISRSFGLLVEKDIKKLIAYSTLNHVSLIIYIYRIQLFKIVYFHLNIHAIFKSLMFICFGYVILSSFHGQDKRLISLIYINPIIKVSYYFSCLCLRGLPFLSAFFSKDFILEKIMLRNIEIFWLVLLILFLGVRVYYRLKLINLTFNNNSYCIVEKNFLGKWRVLIIILVIIVFINVFLSLILRLRLEISLFKFYIYFVILIFGLLSIFTKCNWKLIRYDKFINIKEVWFVYFYQLEQYIYAHIIYMFNYVNYLGNFKMILLRNWWVMVVIILYF